MSEVKVLRRSSVLAGPEGQEFKGSVRTTLSVLRTICDGGSVDEAEQQLRDCELLVNGAGLLQHVHATLEETNLKLQDSEANLLRAAEYGTFLVEEHRREKEDLEQHVDDLRAANKKLKEERDVLDAEVVLWKGWDVHEHNNEISCGEQSDLSDRERDMMRIKNQLQSEVKKLAVKNKDLEVERNVLLTEIAMLREENTEVTDEIRTIDEINQRLGREVSFVRRRERERDTLEAEEATAAAGGGRRMSPRSPAAACGEALGSMLDTDCSEQSVLESFLETPVALKGKGNKLVTPLKHAASVSSDEVSHSTPKRARQLLRIKELQDDIDDWQEKYHTLQLAHEQSKTRLYAGLSVAHATLQQTQQSTSALRGEVVRMASQAAATSASAVASLFAMLAMKELQAIGEQGIGAHNELLQTEDTKLEVQQTSQATPPVPGQHDQVGHEEVAAVRLVGVEAVLSIPVKQQDELQEASAHASSLEASNGEVQLLKQENTHLTALLAQREAEAVSLVAVERQSSKISERVTQQLSAAEVECSVLKREVAMLNTAAATERSCTLHVKELQEQCKAQAAELRMRNAEFKSLLLEHKQLADAKGHELGGEKQKLADAHRRVCMLEETIHRMSQEALDMKEEKEILKRSRGSLLYKVRSSEKELHSLRSQGGSQVGYAAHSAARGESASSKARPQSPDGVRSLLDKYRSKTTKSEPQLKLRTLCTPTNGVCGKLGVPQPCVNAEPMTATRSCSDQYEMNIINGVRQEGSSPHAPSVPSYGLPQRKVRSVENSRSGPRPLSGTGDQGSTAKQPLHAIVQRIAADISSSL